MKKFIVFGLPLLVFVALLVFLYHGLYADPRARDSLVLTKPAPSFRLPDLMDDSLFYDESVFVGQVTLLNVWGVWCVTCAVELPYLNQLRSDGVRIVGLYYDQDIDPDFGGKTLDDVRQEVNEKLAQLGNPYQFNIFDKYRDYALDLGVTGAPETFLIDQRGIILVHHLGDINPRVWRNKFIIPYQAAVAKTSNEGGI